MSGESSNQTRIPFEYNVHDAGFVNREALRREIETCWSGASVERLYKVVDVVDQLRNAEPQPNDRIEIRLAPSAFELSRHMRELRATLYRNPTVPLAVACGNGLISLAV